MNRKTGAYELSVTHEGWVALINEVHKGRHTGNGWEWLIDLSAVVLAMVAATGLWLLFYVRQRVSGCSSMSGDGARAPP